MIAKSKKPRRNRGKSRSSTKSARAPEAVYKAYLRRHELATGGTVPPNWTEDGAGFWYVDGAPENTNIRRVDLKTGKTSSMFDAAKVRAALAAATGTKLPNRGLPFETFRPAGDGKVIVSCGGANWRLDPKTSQVERVGEFFDMSTMIGAVSAEDRANPRKWKQYDWFGFRIDVPEQRSPSGEWFVAVRDNNIVLRSTRDGRELQLTTDGTPDRMWDFGPRPLAYLQGTPKEPNAWSPDSLTLVAYRRDITGVFRMPRVNWLKPFEEVEYLPYQKAGAKLDRVEPVFVDVRSGRQVPVQLPEIEDRHIQLLGWHPGGAEVLIVVYARNVRRVDIVAANRDTGAIRSVMTETGDSFVKVWHDAVFNGNHGFHMLEDGSGFLWLSTRSGWNHIYRYDMNGRLVGQLTSGDWPVYDIELVADDFVYFTAAINQKRPYDVHVCRVPLKGGKVNQLTEATGIHSPSFAPGGQAFLDTHSTVDRPVQTDLVKADGTQLRTLAKMDISRLKEVGHTPVEEFTVKATDGKTDVWGVMYKPFDFNPSKSYPVIEYIYGGPQTIEAKRYFAVTPTQFGNMPWALAHLGYVVVCMDTRGTPGRSKAFHDVVNGNWGAGIPDHADAIRQLCKRHPWMDRNRVGITGHSWGGYYSTCAIFNAPDVYHACVAFAPGYDPWDLILYEHYLDLPQKNRAAYEAADLIKQASKLKGKLMIIVGTSDWYTINSSMKMTRALIEEGTDHEFVAIPQGFHMLSGAEDEYFLMKLTGWFDEHVKNRAVT